MAKDSEGEYARYVETEQDRWVPTKRLARRKRDFYMRRARGRGRHAPEEWTALREYFGGRCVRCLLVPTGERAVGSRTVIWILEKDHIVRVTDGGSDDIGNLQPLCTKCNGGKGNDRTDWRVSAAETLGLEWPRP